MATPTTIVASSNASSSKGPQSAAVAKSSSGHQQLPGCLHRMLAQAPVDDFEDIVSWQPDGKSFAIRHPTKFKDNILPR